MNNLKKTSNYSIDFAVENLIKLPKKNLESRISQINDDLQKRERLSNETLSILGTERLNLISWLWRNRYASIFNESFIVNRDFMRQLSKIEEQRIKEKTNCFADNLKLREKLQEAQEELRLENQKQKLLDSN